MLSATAVPLNGFPMQSDGACSTNTYVSSHITFIVLHPISASATTCWGIMTYICLFMCRLQVKSLNQCVSSYFHWYRRSPCNDQAGVKGHIVTFLFKVILRQWSVHHQFVFPWSLTCSLTHCCILCARDIPIKYCICPSVTVHLLGDILDEVQHDILD